MISSFLLQASPLLGKELRPQPRVIFPQKGLGSCPRMDGKPSWRAREGVNCSWSQEAARGRIPTPTTEHSLLYSRITGIVVTLLNIIFPEHLGWCLSKCVLAKLTDEISPRSFHFSVIPKACEKTCSQKRNQGGQGLFDSQLRHFRNSSS